MRTNSLLTLGLLLGATAVGSAQVVPHRFQVGPRLALMQFDGVSGIENSALIGIDAAYFFTRNLAIGATVDFARPQTDKRYFPAELSFGDTTFVFQVEMPVTIWQYQVTAVGTLPMGSFSPFVTAGFGQYRLFLDPQAARNPTTVTHGLFSVGGGFTVRLGESSGLRLEIRDFIYRNYDLNELNLVETRFQPRRFPDVAPVPDRTCYDAKCNLNNIQFALGFTFVPGGQP